jgi:quercetin dioxygenase-like cupin family protein
VARVFIADQEYALHEGDSIYIYEGLPHRVTNGGDTILRTLSALTPAVF